MTNSTEDLRRGEYIAGLRELADLLEQHPSVPLPYHGTGAEITIYRLSQPDARDRAVDFARAFPGPLAKEFTQEDYGSPGTFRLVGKLRGLSLEFVTYRAQVCRRVVTGTREVTRTVPAPDAPTVEVTDTVEDVEWVCEPLLNAADQAEAITEAGK